VHSDPPQRCLGLRRALCFALASTTQPHSTLGLTRATPLPLPAPPGLREEVVEGMYALVLEFEVSATSSCA